MPSVVAPEADRHRRHRRGDDQLAHARRRTGVPVGVERLDRARRAPAADLARPHRHERRRRRRSRCTRRCRREIELQLDVGADGVVHPAEARRRAAARRSSRRRAARDRSAVAPGARPALRQAMQERRRRPKYVDAGRRPRAATACRGRAAPGLPSNSTIVDADQQAGHEVVPHHPAGGGEPEEAVAGAEVVVQGRAPSGARAGCRRGRGRSAWAARSCPSE